MFPVPILARWPAISCFYSLDCCDAYKKHKRSKIKAIAAVHGLCAPNTGNFAVLKGNCEAFPAGSITCAAEAKGTIMG